MLNNKVDKYQTIPLRLASDGHALPVSEVEQRVLAQMARLQKEQKPYILTVVFDGTNFRVYAGDQRAFIAG